MIRRATQSDAAMLTELARRTFVETFGSFNTPEDMAMFLSKAYTEAVQRREIEDPRLVTLIAEEDGQPAGFMQLMPGHRAQAVDDGLEAIEVCRFYVDRPWHGRGLAQSMMDEVVRLADGLGADVIWLAVWEHNPRAISFYKKFGFRDVGSQPFILGTDLQTDRVMLRSVRL